MVVELISVGTEILMGNIVNTNAQYLANHLAHMGLCCYYQTVVGDNPDRIKAALDIAYSRADMVIMTGGLGPTKDDLTKEMLMEYFNKEAVLDSTEFDMLKKNLEKRGISDIGDSQKKQAMVPKDSIILYNHNGTAPGCIMENNGKYVILLPGPPKEMKPMFEDYCIDYLKQHSNQIFVSINIKVLSRNEAPLAIVGECPVADRLGQLLDNQNPTVATYAKDDGCLVRVTAAAANHEEALKMLEPMIEKCKKAIGEEYIKYIKEDI